MLAEWMRRKRLVLLGLTALLLAAGLAMWGCADHPTSYEDPADGIVTTKTPTALIEAATLAGWIDEGRLNSTDADTRDRIVVLTVASKATYAAGHLPGAQLWDYSAELFQTRLEGVAPMSSMMLTGASLDALLQRFSIDKHTTVVFTVSDGVDLRQATRGYFTLRYWGFPKDRLKVLQGGDTGWTEAGFELTTELPTVAPSDFSVRELAATSAFGGDERASIGDVISAVDKLNNGTLTDFPILDTRGGIDPDTGARLQNAVLDAWNGYYVTGTTATLKPIDELLARLAGFGVTESTAMTLTYCQGGVKATVPYFILDGMLDWPVQMYDGSWGQWSNYKAPNVAAAWQVDAVTTGTAFSRSFGTWTAGTLVVDPVSNASYSSTTDRRANQIEIEDQEYFSSGGTSAPPATGGGGGGTGSGC